MRKMLVPVFAAFAFATNAANASLMFDLSFINGTTVQQQNAFIAAADIWSALLSDNVTIKLTVGTGALGSGILGQTLSVNGSLSYSLFKSLLSADATSATDAIAMSHLAAGNSFGLLMNRTTDNPSGFNSATPFIDNNGTANNSQIYMTVANARALGIDPGPVGLTGFCAVCDGFIEFNNAFSYDYDRSNGITSNAFDFVGIAAHEIGHALGFFSGVDILDYNAGNNYPSSAYNVVAPLDMFRYSDLSAAYGVIDFTADNRNKYFSIDGGLTKGALFSTGVTFGDGNQASHWKDNLGLGIMDPTAAPGELLGVSTNDLLAFDSIGWDIASTATSTPEPNSLALIGLGVAGLVVTRRREKKA